MKILIAANVPKRREGGVAGIVYGVGHGLERRGHQVEYLFDGDLPTAPYLSARFGELKFAIELARFICRHASRYSVVNIHAPAGWAYGLIRHISPRIHEHGPAYVMTLHGLEERRIHNMGREARKGRAFHFNFKNRLWHRVHHMPRFYLSIKTADHALCVSREVWTMLQLKYNLDPDQVSYSPTGVDDRFFIQREYSQTTSARLLFAGTWLDQRGIFYIRDAMRSLASRLRGLRLTIAGCGSNVETIRNFFGPDLLPFVEIISMVPADQMPALFARHDIFIFPSIMEGTPLVVQEAMATGMPVITTETCGMVDLIEDNFNGLLIRPADSVSLTDAIWKLIQNPEMRARLGQSAQATMRRFTWTRTIDIVENACARTLRRLGRETDIRSEASETTSKFIAIEHS